MASAAISRDIASFGEMRVVKSNGCLRNRDILANRNDALSHGCMQRREIRRERARRYLNDPEMESKGGRHGRFRLKQLTAVTRRKRRSCKASRDGSA